MRRFPHVLMYALLLALALFPENLPGTTAGSAGKPRLVLIALDNSGSMRQSDPACIRCDASAMLAAIGGSGDETGVLTFGSDAHWLVHPGSQRTPSEVDAAIRSLTANEQHTGFTAPLALINTWLATQPSHLLKNDQVSVILLTDGRPEPAAPLTATGDEASALALAVGFGQRGIPIYPIGLGSAVETTFLSELASRSGGQYAFARSANQLGEAFLTSLTRIYDLPAYALYRNTGQASVTLGTSVDSAWAFLFRGDASTGFDGVAPLYPPGPSIAVARWKHPGKSLSLRVHLPEGSVLVVCARQPLQFAPQRALPAAALTGSQLPVRLTLQDQRAKPLWRPLFLRHASVELQFRQGGQTRQTSLLQPDGATRSFGGEVTPAQPGSYDLWANLLSPYGAVENYLGHLTVAALAIPVPASIAVNRYGLLPALVNARVSLPLRYVLPNGSAQIVFEPANGIQVTPPSLTLAPQSTGNVRLHLTRLDALGSHPVPYVVRWTDGDQARTYEGTLDLELQQASLFGLLWQWRWWGVIVIVAGAFLTSRQRKRASAAIVTGEVECSFNGSSRTRHLSQLRARRVRFVGAETDGMDNGEVRVAGAEGELFRLSRTGPRGPLVLTPLHTDLCRQGEPVTQPVTVHSQDQFTVGAEGPTFTFYL